MNKVTVENFEIKVGETGPAKCKNAKKIKKRGQSLKGN
jgi:hypothetical protein